MDKRNSNWNTAAGSRDIPMTPQPKTTPDLIPFQLFSTTTPCMNLNQQKAAHRNKTKNIIGQMRIAR